MKKVVVGLLGMCVGLALLQMVVTALLLASVALLLVAFITRPHQTLAFLGTLAVVGLASSRPGIFILVVGMVALALVAVGAWKRPQTRLLLTDHREHGSGQGR